MRTPQNLGTRSKLWFTRQFDLKKTILFFLIKLIMFFVRFKKNGIPLRFADFEVFSLFYSYLIKTNTCFVFGTRSKRATQIDLETKTKKGFLLLLCFFCFHFVVFSNPEIWDSELFSSWEMYVKLKLLQTEMFFFLFLNTEQK